MESTFSNRTYVFVALSLHILINSSSISIRQTKDPYVEDIQYIAYSQAVTDEEGRLDMGDLGVGEPGHVLKVSLAFPSFAPDVALNVTAGSGAARRQSRATDLGNSW